MLELNTWFGLVVDKRIIMQGTQVVFTILASDGSIIETTPENIVRKLNWNDWKVLSL